MLDQQPNEAETVLVALLWRARDVAAGLKGGTLGRVCHGSRADGRRPGLGQQLPSAGRRGLAGGRVVLRERAQILLTNLPRRTTRRTLAGTIKARWICEQSHRQLKEELAWTTSRAAPGPARADDVHRLRLPAAPASDGAWPDGREKRWPACLACHHHRACPPCVRPSSADCSRRSSRPMPALPVPFPTAL